MEGKTRESFWLVSCCRFSFFKALNKTKSKLLFNRKHYFSWTIAAEFLLFFFHQTSSSSSLIVHPSLYCTSTTLYYINTRKVLDKYYWKGVGEIWEGNDIGRIFYTRKWINTDSYRSLSYAVYAILFHVLKMRCSSKGLSKASGLGFMHNFQWFFFIYISRWD